MAILQSGSRSKVHVVLTNINARPCAGRFFVLTFPLQIKLRLVLRRGAQRTHFGEKVDA